MYKLAVALIVVAVSTAGAQRADPCPTSHYRLGTKVDTIERHEFTEGGQRGTRYTIRVVPPAGVRQDTSEIRIRITKDQCVLESTTFREARLPPDTVVSSRSVVTTTEQREEHHSCWRWSWCDLIPVGLLAGGIAALEFRSHETDVIGSPVNVHVYVDPNRRPYRQPYPITLASFNLRTRTFALPWP